MSSQPTGDIVPPPPSARPPRKKRKVVEPRFVDVATLPDIDEIDLDSIKNFDKDQLRAYLKFYDVVPGETKPDMKKQLRTLVGAIRAGQIPKRSTTNPGATVPISTPLAKAISRVSVGTPIPAPLLTGAPFPTPSGPVVTALPSAPVPTETQTPREMDTFSYFMGIRPDQPSSTPNSQANSNIQMASAVAANIVMPGPDDADMSCLGCGKRANKDCKFRRCKNCCNAAMLKCTVHARFIPGLTSKALLEDAPPGGIPAPQLSSIQPQTPSVGEMQSYADMAREREREAILNVPPVPMVSFLGWDDMKVEESPNAIVQLSHKPAAKRMKLNGECVDAIFDCPMHLLSSSLTNALGAITPDQHASEAMIQRLEAELEAERAAYGTVEDLKTKGIQEQFAKIWQLLHDSTVVAPDPEAWQSFKQTIEQSRNCTIIERTHEDRMALIANTSRAAGGMEKLKATSSSRQPHDKDVFGVKSRLRKL